MSLNITVKVYDSPKQKFPQQMTFFSTPQGPKWSGFMWRRVDSWLERELALNMTDKDHDSFKKYEL